MILTDAQVVKLAAGGFLMSRHVAALSAFEAETFAEVGLRFGRFKRDALVTDHEWAVIDSAIAAMEAARRADEAALASLRLSA